MMFSFKARIKSFIYAFKGVQTLLKNEHNAWIHLFITICVIIVGILLELSSSEWIVIIFAIGFVFSAEAFNSAIEYLADRVSKEQHPLIKQAKDVSAAAVLIAAVTAVITGLIIFIPKLTGL